MKTAIQHQRKNECHLTETPMIRNLFKNDDMEDLEKTESKDLKQDYKEGEYILVSFPGKRPNVGFVCVNDNELETVSLKNICRF